VPLIWSLINQTSVLVCTKATSQYIPCPASWLSENHTAQNKRPFTTKSIICFHLFKFYAVKCAKTLIFCFIDFLFYWNVKRHLVTLLIIWIFLLRFKTLFKTTLSLTSSSFSLYTLSYFVSCSHTFMTLMFQFISIIVRCCSIIFRYFILLHHLMLNY